MRRDSERVTFREWIIRRKQKHVSKSIQVERKKALTVNIPDKLQQIDRYYLH